MENTKKTDATLESSKSSQRQASWTPLLILVCFATTLGTAIPVGYFLGVLNTPAAYIKAWCAAALLHNYQWQLNDAQIDVLWASIISIFLIGGICGSFAGAKCCNKFGRKGCLLISAFLLFLAGFLLNFCRLANSVEMLLLARFLAGIAAAFIYTAHPMYLLELAPAHLRGSVAVFTSIGVTGGICVGQIFSLQQIFGTESLWEYALSFYAVFVVLGFLPGYWFPESPRWLFMVKGDAQMARSELERIRGRQAEDVISAEIADMKLECNAMTETQKSSFLQVLTDPVLLLPLVIVCSFQACQQLSGINAIFFYSVPIFTKAGFSSENAAWMNLAAGFLNFLVCTLSPFFMLKFNRRPLMMLSCAGCGIALFGMAFALNYVDHADWLATACIVFIACFIFFFNLGLAPIPYFIGSEIFEVKPRPVAMSMGSLFSWMGNFMIGMVFPIVQGFWGSFAFLPCAIMCLYGLLLTYCYMPETRGRDVADLKPLMANGFKSKVRQC